MEDVKPAISCYFSCAAVRQCYIARLTPLDTYNHGRARTQAPTAEDRGRAGGSVDKEVWHEAQALSKAPCKGRTLHICQEPIADS